MKKFFEGFEKKAWSLFGSGTGPSTPPPPPPPPPSPGPKLSPSKVSAFKAGFGGVR